MSVINRVVRIAGGFHIGKANLSFRHHITSYGILKIRGSKEHIRTMHLKEIRTTRKMNLSYRLGEAWSSEILRSLSICFSEGKLEALREMRERKLRDFASWL